MPSLASMPSRNPQMPFTPVKQHATNTNLVIECVECSKPRLIFSKTKLSSRQIKSFKLVVKDFLYTCGATMIEFQAKDVNSSHQYILDMVFVRGNFTCSKPVECLYYSAGHPDCCVHCGESRWLETIVNAYPMCEPCKQLKKREPVMKRKQNRVNVAGTKKLKR